MTVRFDIKESRRTTSASVGETALYRDGVRIQAGKDGTLDLELQVGMDMSNPLPKVYFQGERQTDCDVYVQGVLRAKVRPEITEFFEGCTHHVEDDICIKCGASFMQYL